MKGLKIFDASTLVCIFQEAKFPKIIDNCLEEGYKLVIPNQVYDEIKENKNTLLHLMRYEGSFLIRDCPIRYFDYISRRYPRLHKGEVSVISLGLEYESKKKRYICLLDDDYARNICKKFLIRTSGVLGLIMWEKRIGYIDSLECKIIHENLSQSSFYITKDLLDELVR